jgi:hypothetical protein
MFMRLLPARSYQPPTNFGASLSIPVRRATKVDPLAARRLD